MKVIFFGTPLFAVEILKCLLDNQIDVVAIVTKPDKKQGRQQKLKPLPVKQFVEDNHIPIPLFQPEKISTIEWEEKLKSFEPDLFVVVAFGEIIKQNILNVPKLDPINIHASLLPKYRGAAPIHRAIINGDTETGITIMEMVKALDAGDIIHVEKVFIDKDMNVSELEKKLISAAKVAVLKAIDLYEKKSVKKIPQKDSEATYAHKISPEECKVDFLKKTLPIYNLIRGSTPFPGAWFEIQLQGQVKRLKVKKAKILSDIQGLPKQILKFEKNSFIIAAADGAISLEEVQLEGKKVMSAKEFILGYPVPVIV